MRSTLALVLLLPVACSSVDGGGTSEGGSETTDVSVGSQMPSSSLTSGGNTGGEDEGGSVSASGPGTSDPDRPTTGGPTTGVSGDSDTADPGGTGVGSTGGDEHEPIPPGPTIPVDGGDYFLLGANYPWKSYGGDFGGNAWGTYGVHTKPDEYAAQFQQMADGGLQVVRWFVFTDGRAGVIFDNSGTPTGLGEDVLVDLDAAVAIARDRGLYLVPVLFDFHWMDWGKQVDGVQVGGRSDTITDPIKRAALVEKVVIPLLEAYAGEPTVLAWEIMNEPEWSISDLPDGSPNQDINTVPLQDFYALSTAIADAVRSETGAYVTLGSASLKWVKVWTPQFAVTHGLAPLELDFYQAHYYSWMDGQGFEDHADYGTLKFSPFEQTYGDLGLDRPLVIGELVISDDAGMRLDALVGNGYAGAWPWSLNSDYSLDLPGIKDWAAAHAPLADLPPP